MLAKEVLENHQRYLERKLFFKNYGFDIDKERKFIFDKAGAFSGTILEVGTGKGHFTLMLARNRKKITSIDISEEEQKIAKLNLQYYGLDSFVDLKVENAECLSFADKSFDIIFSVNTFHHFEVPLKVIDEFLRVISDKGKIVISDFSKEGFSLVEQMHKDEGRTHNKGTFILSDVKDYFKKKGYVIDQDESKFQEILTIYKG